VGHLPPEQQPHRLRGGVREDFVHPVLLVPADPEHLSVAGGQRERAVGAGALPDAGLAGGLPLHPPRHRVHRQGEEQAQPSRARAGCGEDEQSRKAEAMAAVPWGYSFSPGAASPAASAALLSYN